MNILNIFKSKPKLKDLISDDFIDIHSHFLPGIDDGATAIGESIEMLTASKSLGIKKFIFTPHIYKDVYDNSKETITNSFQRLINSPNFDSTIKVSFGAEYYVNDYLMELIKKKDILCIKDNYILIELSFINAPLQLKEYIYEIKLAGYQPILAHPERYVHCSNLVKYEQLKSLGLQFQLNLNSCTGFYGKEVAEKAELLLKNELIDFVGTDFHRMEYIFAFENNLLIHSIPKLEKAIASNNFFNS